jgi:hypothetical protein
MQTECYCPLCGAPVFAATYIRETEDGGLEDAPLQVCNECHWDSWWVLDESEASS